MTHRTVGHSVKLVQQVSQGELHLTRSWSEKYLLRKKIPKDMTQEIKTDLYLL